MSKGSYKRYTLFSGFGVGAGLGFGCGVGAGTGIGGVGLPGARLPGFGGGGGCGLGLGAGWGFFALGFGVVVRGADDMTGRTRRRVARAAERIRREREAGLRPPRRDPAKEDAGLDPLLDRIIRHIETRRALQGLRRGGAR